MKIEAKRPGRTMPRTVAMGDLHSLEFDGYELTAHMFDGEGRELRVRLERHELTRLIAYAQLELDKQRRALAELQRTTDRIYADAGGLERV